MATTKRTKRASRPRRGNATLGREKAKSAALAKSLAEAMLRQAAAAEILKIISRSPADPQPVFDAIARSARRLFGAHSAYVARLVGDTLHLAALTATTKSGDAALKKLFPSKLTGEGALGKAIFSGKPAWVADFESDPAYSASFRRGVRARGYRSLLTVPMLREGTAIGGIVVTRRAPGRFTDAQIRLLQTFADQAVIAIENVRLFNETKEALERQTATADILKVISSSPTVVQPVFDAIVESATRLFGRSARIRLMEGNELHLRASSGPAGGAMPGAPLPVTRDNIAGRAVLDKVTMQIADTQAPGVPAGNVGRGYRAIAAAPLLREGNVLGAVAVTSLEPGALSDKQMALLRTFAAQAVIAIENVRLFKELEARNRDLSETLEQQTATAEILRVISSSPTTLGPVLEAVVKTAARLCDATNASLYRVEGDFMRKVAGHGSLPTAIEVGDTRPVTRGTVSGCAILERRTLHIADLLAEADTQDPVSRDYVRREGIRTFVATPLLREGVPIGAITVYRTEVRLFSDKQIGLLQTFADQALIAIENVRMFNETQEALARQEAAAQVLRSISESVSDTAPVFTAILDCCNRLIPSIDYVQVQLIEGSDRVRLVDHRFGQVRGAAPGKQDERRAELMAREAAYFPRPLAGSTLERALHLGRVVILADTLDGPDTPPGTLVEARRWGHSYSQITVPLMREGRCIGAIEAFRRQLGGFEAKESSLLESFADQAVIAIENARLFNETKESLERQTATAEILQVISGSPTDEAPVFDAILRSALRLFGGMDASVLLLDGDRIQLAAAAGETDLETRRRLFPIALNDESIVGRAILGKSVIDVADLESPDAPPFGRKYARQTGYRAITNAPLIREGVATGTISIARRSPGALDAKQLALLKTFADQAVIAIENVRLFKELQSRTEALTKSVGQLTALGEVGQAISSTLDLEKVLKTIATHAVRLTGLDGASIYEYDEASEEFRLQVADSFAPEFLQAIRAAPIRKGDGTVGGVAITLEPAQVSDILDDSYHSSRKELLVGAGYRAVLTVPLLREDHIIGALSVTRKTPGPFSEEIVELLKTFATQSAMAIQNARLFREIAEKGKQLEEASRHKSQFLASMSHELRTPLNAILGFNEMILGDVYGEVPADMKEPLTDIQTSGKHLLRLINNVLDLAKIEAGRMELAIDEYSVHDTVEGVRSTLRPLAEAKGLELAVSVPPDIPLARGDGGRITQCLMNLAGNSLKFTKQGSVSISVALENGTLTYRVKDTGIGIPADKIGSLFTEFKQTDATIASEYGGTGLGLSITKKFIDMHGGRIWAESEPGSGSTFIFELPLRAGEARQA